MPEMDGLALLKQVSKEHPKTPFLLMTAHGDSQLGDEAMELGAYAYLENQSTGDTSWIVSGVR